MFLYIDLDGSGNIEYKEFCRRLGRAGVKVKTEEKDFVQRLYKEITDNGFSDLKEAFEKFCQSHSDAFDKYDITKNQNKGKLTLKNLQEAVKIYGIPVTKDVLRYFFNLADTSKDGNIDYHEFYAVFHTHVPALSEKIHGEVMELDWKMRFMKNLNDTLNA